MMTMRYLKFLLQGALLIVPVVSSGCSCSDKPCSVGDTECVRETGVRICVSGKEDEDNYWVAFSCGAGEVCQVPGSDGSIGLGLTKADAGTAGDSGTTEKTATESAHAMCVGTCTVGKLECVSKQLARNCVDGMHWETFRCEEGEQCSEGVCQHDSEGVYPDLKICKAGEKACASERLAKICDSDGTSWIGLSCRTSEVCSNGACVVSTKAVCDPDEGRCDDYDNALIRCLKDGVGYEKVACPADTHCGYGSSSNGSGYACVGDVCAIGSACVAQTTEESVESSILKMVVRECADGKSYKYSRCEVNERCVQITPWLAQCMDQPTNCNPGEVVCGDPSATAVDKTLFSVCVDDPQNGKEGARWIVNKCEGANFACDPAAADAGSQLPCSKECTPGEERCAPPAERPVDITHARQVCKEDGTWGDATPCSTGAQSYQVCAKTYQLPGKLPKTVCADPVCARNGVLVEEGTSACLNETQYLPCDPATGQLADSAGAKNCPSGLCLPTVSPTAGSFYTTARAEDGRIRGACLDPFCKAGDQMCVKTIPVNSSDDPEYTSRYISCADTGKWNTKPSNCANNERCIDYQTHDQIWHMICGGNCVPGSQGCTGEGSATDKIRTCDKNGDWSVATDCAFGICNSSRSECIAECLPKEKRCVGITKSATDGFHQGTHAMVTCGDKGVWSVDQTACEGTTTCRASGAGVVLGCVECVGPSVIGGNEEKLVDSRCSGEAVQDCNAANSGFENSTECTGNLHCQPAGSRECIGTCTSASGYSVTCAQHLRQQQCGSCNLPGYGTVATCTRTALSTAVSSVAGFTTLSSGCTGTSGAYAANLNVNATYVPSINVSAAVDPITVRINTSYRTYNSNDYGYIQYSWNGSAWFTAGSAIYGDSAGWIDTTRTITRGANTTMYLRFNFRSDSMNSQDGWRINTVNAVDSTSPTPASLLSTDFASGTTSWTFDAPWGTEVVLGPSGVTNVTVITESPAAPFDLGVPGNWAGIPTNDCCAVAQVTNTAYTCPSGGATVATDNYADCCANAVEIGGSGVAWCAQE